MRVAITGHRPNKLGNDYNGTGPISQYIKEEIYGFLRHHEPSVAISGMALGVDTLFANISLHEPYIEKLIAAIPFVGQERMWPYTSQEIYRFILESPKVEKVIVSEGGYHPSKMQIRNMWMVDNCDVLIAVWDGSPGGTGNCVKYAQSVNKKIYRIDPLNAPNIVV
jgi:uncharacterized phage-like protein YoqJ